MNYSEPILKTWREVAIEAKCRAEAAEQTLAQAWKELAGAGVGGIYDAFTSLPDAIRQMALHSKQMEQRIEALEETLLQAVGPRGCDLFDEMVEGE